MEGHMKILNHEESLQIMGARLDMVKYLFKCWKTVHLTGIKANLEWICNEHRHVLIQIAHVIDAVEELRTKME